MVWNINQGHLLHACRSALSVDSRTRCTFLSLHRNNPTYAFRPASETPTGSPHRPARQAQQAAGLDVWEAESQTAPGTKPGLASVYSLGKFGVKGFLSSSHCLFLPGTGPMPHKRAPHFYLNSVPHTVRTTHSTRLFESSELSIVPGTDPASWSPGFFDFGFAAVLTTSYSPGMSHFSLFSLASFHYQISMEEEPALFPWPGISPSLFHLAMVSAW